MLRHTYACQLRKAFSKKNRLCFLLYGLTAWREANYLSQLRKRNRRQGRGQNSAKAARAERDHKRTQARSPWAPTQVLKKDTSPCDKGGVKTISEIEILLLPLSIYSICLGGANNSENFHLGGGLIGSRKRAKKVVDTREKREQGGDFGNAQGKQ